MGLNASVPGENRLGSRPRMIIPCPRENVWASDVGLSAGSLTCTSHVVLASWLRFTPEPCTVR